MASTIFSQDPAHASVLSDGQIIEMLQAAETRLKSQQGAMSLRAKGSGSQSASAQLRLSSSHGTALVPLVQTNINGAKVDPSQMLTSEHRKLASGPRTVNDSTHLNTNTTKEKKPHAGSDWYDLPRTNLTPELKRDLQLLRMRSVLDPKRHYKKDNSNKNFVPEFSQVGTIIEGPTEYFSARLSNKERKRTLVEEVLEREKNSQRFKSKYRDIQEAKVSGKKAHYKALKAKRRSKG